MGKQVKLHLACGTVYLHGYTNIDVKGSYTYLASDRPNLVEINGTTKENYYKQNILRDDFVSKKYHNKYKVVDMFGDVTRLPTMLNHVDEILAVQVLEHFSEAEAIEVLKKWISKLKKGGVLEVDVPDLDGTVELFSKRETPEDLDWFLRLMFGSQKDQYSYHKWMYTKESLYNIFLGLGLEDIEILPNIHTYPGFAIRGVRKGKLNFTID